MAPFPRLASSRSSQLNAGCSWACGRSKCSAFAMSVSVWLFAPAHVIASASEMLNGE
jgi:hypothetical protein